MGYKANDRSGTIMPIRSSGPYVGAGFCPECVVIGGVSTFGCMLTGLRSRRGPPSLDVVCEVWTEMWKRAKTIALG
jgi:hypothetical protein